MFTRGYSGTFRGEYKIMNYRMPVLALLCALALAAVGFASAQEKKGAQDSKGVTAPEAASPPAPANPLKVALLHWYKADIVTKVTVGNQP
jgi:hypothetical protein